MRQKKQDARGTAFADLVWKPVVLIEMKKRGEDLSRHYRQALNYWTQLVPGRPRYAVLCNFDEFWVYDFETQMDTPVDQVKLSDLPERYGPLAFLFQIPERPTFGNDHEAVTRGAADNLAVCFSKLVAVLDAYGFSAKKDLLTQLLKLNLSVASRLAAGDSIGSIRGQTGDLYTARTAAVTFVPDGCSAKQ